MRAKPEPNILRMMYCITVMVIGTVFVFVIGENGPIVSDDSIYFMGNPETMPLTYCLYPIFLYIHKFLFGESFFLQAVVVSQGILAIVSSIVIAEFFRKEYKLNYGFSILVFGLSLLPYGYSLPDNVATHHILTEGLAFPIFHIYFLVVIKLFLYEKKRHVIEGIILSGALVVLRSQLIIFMLAFVLFALLLEIKKAYHRVSLERKKQFSICVIIVFCTSSLLCIGCFGKKLLSGEFSQFSDAITGRVICLSEYEDSRLFEGETKEVFLELYENAKHKGNLVDVYEPCRAEEIAYRINENTKDWPVVISDYYNEQYSDVTNPDKMYKYRMRNDVVWELFDAHLGDYILFTMKLLPYSFVASIFIQPDAIYGLCHAIAMVIYIIAVVLAIYAKKRGCVTKYIIPFVITLIMIVINVVATNIFFYGQQRYVVYLFGMFYISVLLEILGIYRLRRRE